MPKAESKESRLSRRISLKRQSGFQLTVTGDQSDVCLASVALVCITGLVALLLLDLYKDSRAESTSRLWRSRWEIQMEGFSKRTLILASLLGLFLELMLIRWVSSEIRIFAYFKNFVLMACFLGFGLGCSLCHRKINLLPSFVSLLMLTLIIKLPWEPLRRLIDSLPQLLASFSDINIWYVQGGSLTSESLLQLLACSHYHFTALCVAGAGFASPRADCGLAV